jgi:suppressor for copper-sensitivity B
MKLRRLRPIRLGLLALLAMLAPIHAVLAAGPADAIRLELLQGPEGYAGLHLRLTKGWKFYWRQPGDGGIPPRFDWSGSENLANLTVEWPAPRRFAIGDSDIIGYEGETLLPLRFTRAQAGKPARLSAQLEYGICREICVLREDRLTLDLPPGAGAGAALVGAYLARVPGPLAGLGLQSAGVAFAPGELRLSLRAQTPLVAPDLFVEGPEAYWFGRPSLYLLAGGVHEIRLPFTPGSPPPVGSLRFTLVDGARAAEFKP